MTLVASPVEHKEIATPTGYLRLAADGSATAWVRASLRSREAVADAVQAIARLTSDIVRPCSSFVRAADGFVLEWPSEWRLTPLGHVTAKWRADPATYLPSALAFARQLSRASSDLEALRPHRFLVSPAQVFVLESEEGPRRWAVLPVPLEGADLSDWVTAADECLTWSGGNELLGLASADRPYLIAAALYDSLIGDLFPPQLSRRERVRRVLQYQGGQRARTHAVLAQAVPPSLQRSALELARFLHDLLAPSFGRVWTPLLVQKQLDRFEDELSAPVLAAAWESADATGRAVNVLNAFAQVAAPGEVPWDAVARLRRITGDPAGADAAEAHVPRSEEERQASLIRSVREMTGDLPARRDDLELAVSRLWTRPDDNLLMRPGTSATVAIGDEEFLYLAYANARWFGRSQQSLELLRREFPVSWHSLVRTLLAGRMSADLSSWEETSRQCRDARKLVDRLPNKGGDRGRHLRAYIDLLDAIAHVGAVERGHTKEYFNKAFQHLGEAWDGCAAVSDSSLAADVCAWSLYLASRTRVDPALGALRLGVEAFCHAIGAEPLTAAQVSHPAVPWPPEEHLFIA